MSFKTHFFGLFNGYFVWVKYLKTHWLKNTFVKLYHFLAVTWYFQNFTFQLMKSVIKARTVSLYSIWSLHVSLYNSYFTNIKLQCNSGIFNACRGTCFVQHWLKTQYLKKWMRHSPVVSYTTANLANTQIYRIIPMSRQEQNLIKRVPSSSLQAFKTILYLWTYRTAHQT